MLPTGERRRTNVWGRYYVTDECDGCGVCAIHAPLNFERSWDRTYYAVAQQPQDEAEEGAMRAAIAACPLHCIEYDPDMD